MFELLCRFVLSCLDMLTSPTSKKKTRYVQWPDGMYFRARGESVKRRVYHSNKPPNWQMGRRSHNGGMG